jgi:hypothetical protein
LDFLDDLDLTVMVRGGGGAGKAGGKVKRGFRLSKGAGQKALEGNGREVGRR